MEFDVTLLHRARRLFRRFGLEVYRANPITVWRCRLPKLLNMHGIGLVLDVGANDGAYALSLIESGYPGNVLSFEPLPSAHARLELRSAKHGLGRWQVAPRGAIGNRVGHADLIESGNSVSSSTLPILESHVEAAPDSAPVATHTVPIWRVDDVLEQQSFRSPAEAKISKVHLKIDVQGAELQVLEGAERSLGGPIHSVQVEMSLIELYRGQALAEELHCFLSTHGFELWDIIPGFRSQHDLRLLQYDGFYIRRDKQR